MKWMRYLEEGRPTWACRDDDGPWHTVDGDPFGDHEVRGDVPAPPAARTLPPVVPSKVIGVGLNYRAHAMEAGKPLPDEPLLFLKPPSCLIGDGREIAIPVEEHRVDHEAELAVVIGRRARDVPAGAWRDVVFGLTCANDVSDRDYQRGDGQFTRAKGFDTFGPLGPWIETDLDPGDLEVVCRVNGATRQRGTTRDLVFDVPALIAYVSSIMTLEPGDVVLTGTPSGVSALHAGDVVEVEVEGIGPLRNRVVAAAARGG
jgi:2-keto-4-pentenoate hydratase/2-oxohepta-3-ene-1,7-dioic acid hydratase in catechol pathway